MDSIYIIKVSLNILNYYHLSNVVIIFFVCLFLVFLN